MVRKNQSMALFSMLMLTLFLLSACSLFGKTSSTHTTPSTLKKSTSTATNSSSNSTNRPVTGPLVIETPTLVPNGSPTSQQIGLVDRTLVIENVSRQDNNTATTTVTISLLFKNSGSKDIKNQASSYQLVGTEGDMFGLPPATNSDFFGTISAGSTQNGTLVFPQIPAAAINKLQLLYRSESAQVIFIPLNI